MRRLRWPGGGALCAREEHTRRKKEAPISLKKRSRAKNQSCTKSALLLMEGHLPQATLVPFLMVSSLNISLMQKRGGGARGSEERASFRKPLGRQSRTSALRQIPVIAHGAEVLKHKDRNRRHNEQHYKHHHPDGSAEGFCRERKGGGGGLEKPAFCRKAGDVPSPGEDRF